jgi:hypothetical protein
MARWKGNTTQRGMGSGHQRLGKQRRAQWHPGDPCAHCGQPINWLWRITPDGRRISMVDLPHMADRSGYLPGLSCSKHNRSEGATRGNRQRGTVSVWRTARRW